MIPEEQMPHQPPFPSKDKELALKFLGAIIIFIFVIYISTLFVLSSTFIPQMEEAGEETAELISTGEAGAGGSVQVIRHDFAGEVRTAYLVSLISFGILDGLFALILWLRRPKRGHESALISMAVIQIINRPFTAYLMVQFSIMVFVGSSPEIHLNVLYLIIIISSILSLVLVFIVHQMLSESKTRKIGFKIRENAPV